MSRSSTSSFERGFFACIEWRAVALACALLLAFELGVARSDALWDRAPKTMVGAFFALEREVIARTPEPWVTFLGSSRIRDAVAPRVLERELGVPPGTILNLGLTNGTPFEALSFYQRHRERLRRSRVLVIGVEDWYWNAGMPPTDVERLFASFSDRLAWFERRHRPGDLIGGLFRSVELQDPILKWASSFVSGVKPIELVDGRMAWRSRSELRDIGPSQTDIAAAIAQNLQSFELGPSYEPALQTLLGLAQQDHVPVVVTQLPARNSYCDEVARRFPALQPHARHRATELAREHHAKVQLFERGSDIGIPDDRFYDYGHLTEDGSRRMNQRWKVILGPFLPSAGPP